MICSCDLNGRVVITTITVLLGFLKASKYTILDPTKQNISAAVNYDLQKFQVVSPRFHDKIFPMGVFNDSQTWIALASVQED